MFPAAVLLTAMAAAVLQQASRAGAQAARPPGKAPDLAKALWVWAPDSTVGAGAVCFLRRKFDLASAPVEATVVLTADNGYELYVNNKRIAGELGYDRQSWASVERFRIESHLHEGANVLAIRGECLGGSAGVVAAMYIRTADGKGQTLVTDGKWLGSAKSATTWTQPDHDDSLWKPAKVMAKIGGQPWGMLSVPSRLTDPKKLTINRGIPGRRAPAKAQFTEPPDDFQWPGGVVFLAGRAPVHSTRAQTTKFLIGRTESSFEYDTPAPSVSGYQLYALTPAEPDAKPRLLLDAKAGLIASPICSYDGREIVFAMAPAGEKFFKLYRIGADGSSLQRLTEGPWQDYDPAILPDGRIVFASSRIGSREEYHGNPARSLFVLSADRKTIRPLTYHIVADSQPRVMSDGRIAFVRQDNFMERAKVETLIHAVHPDGTAGQTLVGPDRGAIRYDRPTGAEHPARWLRNYGFGSPAPLPDGRIACLSNYGPVLTTILLRDQVRRQRMPSEVPLFDISPMPDGRLLCSTPRGVLGIVEPDTGKAVMLHQMQGQALHSAAYLGRRPRPPVIANMVSAQAGRTHDDSGFLLCQDIFNTQQVAGDWRRVKAVRVIQGKPLTLRSARHQYDHIGTEGVELGTAPLAPDGSFYVRVPADRALAIQAIDAEGRPVVNEMSWIYVRPGETRSCIGCHNPRQSAPQLNGRMVLAAKAPPVDLRGGDQPLRFRANNAANGGVLNLQFDRFREVAGIDLHRQGAFPRGFVPTALPPGRPAEVTRLGKTIEVGRPAEAISAIDRLATFRDRAAVPALIKALGHEQAGVRRAAAMALGSCGNRGAAAALLKALRDESPPVAQAAHVALEHLTGQTRAFNPYGDRDRQLKQAETWQDWLDDNSWGSIEKDLIARLASDDPITSHLAAEAMGHVGGASAKAALRKYLESSRKDSLVARLAAIRALGHLRDESAVPLLAKILETNTVKRRTRAKGSHEFGWAAPPDHLAGAAAEALGWIGSPQAEQRLIAAYGKLAEFWFYTFRTADHDWLMGCHSSIVHYRIAEALDAIGSKKAGPLTAGLLLSVPIDPDRGLLHENDAYEVVIGRLINRSGTAAKVIDTCLSVLGDKQAKATPDLIKGVTASPPARSVKPLSREARAAHLLSVVCLRGEDAPRIRAAFQRYRAAPPSRKRCWVGFFLARTLGKLRDAESVGILRETLDKDPTEFSFGVPNPPNVFIHNAMTPTYRAAVADALGRIGDAKAVPSLLAAVGNFDNVMDVREAAADALRRIADPASLAQLRQLADGYPEITTQRALWRACAAAKPRQAASPRASSN